MSDLYNASIGDATSSYGLVVEPYLFNGSTYDRTRSAGATGVTAVGGSAAIGVTASGNPVQAGGIFNTTPATITNGQAGALQLDNVQNLLAKINAALPTGTNAIGTVQPGNTPNTSAWLVQPVPGTANGLTTYNLEPAASDNHANIKNGAGVVYHISATNNSATVNYLRLYNAATGFNGCNSATNLMWEVMIPSSTSGAGFVEDIASGLTFSTGISICVTSAFGQTNTTNATASAMEVNIGYK